MLDVDAQREVFERVREAAKRHGLLVAPIVTREQEAREGRQAPWRMRLAIREGS